MQFVIAYISTGIVFLAVDAVWLKLMADRLYRPLMGNLVAESFSLAPAAVFYLLYIAGIVVFAVQPALVSGRWMTALALGAFLGLVAYGTYDLSNQATLRNWPLLLTVVDIAWGAALTAMAATAGTLITRGLTGGSG